MTGLEAVVACDKKTVKASLHTLSQSLQNMRRALTHMHGKDAKITGKNFEQYVVFLWNHRIKLNMFVKFLTPLNSVGSVSSI